MSSWPVVDHSRDAAIRAVHHSLEEGSDFWSALFPAEHQMISESWMGNVNVTRLLPHVGQACSELSGGRDDFSGRVQRHGWVRADQVHSQVLQLVGVLRRKAQSLGWRHRRNFEHRRHVQRGDVTLALTCTGNVRSDGRNTALINPFVLVFVPLVPRVEGQTGGAAEKRHQLVVKLHRSHRSVNARGHVLLGGAEQMMRDSNQHNARGLAIKQGTDRFLVHCSKLRFWRLSHGWSAAGARVRQPWFSRWANSRPRVAVMLLWDSRCLWRQR